MKTIRTIIVDDEAPCRRGVKLLLDEGDDFEIVAQCSDGHDAVTQISMCKPDLVFLDIQMPEATGFDVLRNIDPAHMPFIIFVTAYDEYAVKAFEVNALDYVLKPFSRKRFLRALEKARIALVEKDIAVYGKSLIRLMADLDLRESRMQENRYSKVENYLERILIKVKDRLKFIEVTKVDWIEGANYYVELHCGKRSYLYRESMKNLECKLSPASFLRIHKSTIVNLKSINEIRTGFDGNYIVVLNSGDELRVSRRKKKELIAFCEDKFGLKNR